MLCSHCESSNQYKSLPTTNTENAMNMISSVVAIYDSHEQAERTIRELQEVGVDMKSRSIAAPETHTPQSMLLGTTAPVTV